jgi:hypothetical protein
MIVIDVRDSLIIDPLVNYDLILSKAMPELMVRDGL